MLKKIYTLSDGGNEKKIINEIKNESNSEGVDFEILDLNKNLIFYFNEEESDIISNNKKIILNKNEDYFFARFYGKSKKISGIFELFLEKKGIKKSFSFFKQSAGQMTKYFQALYFNFNKIKTPVSIIGTDISLVKNIDFIEKEIGYPMVLKGNGSKGETVFLNKDRDELLLNLKKLSGGDFYSMDNDSVANDDVYTIQKVVDCDYDIRLIFFKDKFLFGMRRFADGFLNNYNQGGNVEKYIPTEKDLEISRSALKDFGMDYVAIDIMHEDDGKPVVLEIQVGHWTHGMREAHGDNINIGEVVFREIKKEF